MNDTVIVNTIDSHLEKIAEIEAKCFSDPWSKQSFADGMKNENVQTYFTALKNETVVGYVCIFHIFEDGEILNIAVDPEFRKMGIAKMLLDRAFEFLKENKVTRVTLEVRESNTAARCLYEKNGFLPIGIRKNYYHAPTENGIVMEKTL